jgi:hypothetical protein
MKRSIKHNPYEDLTGRELQKLSLSREAAESVSPDLSVSFE